MTPVDEHGNKILKIVSVDKYITGTSFAEVIDAGSVDRPSSHTGTTNVTVS